MTTRRKKKWKMMTPSKIMAGVKKKKSTALFNRLVKAAQKYVEFHGGTCLVGGPIQILTWPSESKYKYGLVVQMMGRLPTKELEKE